MHGQCLPWKILSVNAFYSWLFYFDVGMLLLLFLSMGLFVDAFLCVGILLVVQMLLLCCFLRWNHL